MTFYTETNAVLRRLFPEAGGEAARAALAVAEKVAVPRLPLIETRRVAWRADRARGGLAAQADRGLVEGPAPPDARLCPVGLNPVPLEIAETL